MPWPSLRRAGRTGSGSRDFGLLWTSTTVSTLGDATTTVALPLVAVVTLHASTFEVGFVSAAAVGAWIVFGLTAGVWVDRLPKRPLLVVCDVVRAIALVSVPVAALAGALTLPHLVVAGFLVNVGSVFAAVGFQSYVPSVVDQDHLLVANSRLQGSEQAALVGGPPLGGALVQLVGAPATLLADVASYVISGLCLWRISGGREAPAETSGGGLLAQVAEGLRFVWRHPILRPLALAAASINLWSTAFTTLSVVFLIRTLHVSPGLVGLLFAADGLGGVLGALLAGRFVDRLGNAGTLRLAVIAGPLLSLLMPLTVRGPGLVLFALGSLGFAVFVVAFSVVARVYRQTISPPHLLGRVTAVNRFISWGVLPVGAVLAGGLGSAIGTRATMWVLAVGVIATTPLPLAFSPVWRSRELAAGTAGTTETAEAADTPAAGPGPSAQAPVTTQEGM